MQAIIHAADVQDRDGGALLMATLFGSFPFLTRLFADGGYQGPQFKGAIQRTLPAVLVEIVKRPDQAKSFVVLPKRWIIERTLAAADLPSKSAAKNQQVSSGSSG
jgi:transposase